MVPIQVGNNRHLLNRRCLLLYRVSCTVTFRGLTRFPEPLWKRSLLRFHIETCRYRLVRSHPFQLVINLMLLICFVTQATERRTMVIQQPKQIVDNISVRLPILSDRCSVRTEQQQIFTANAPPAFLPAPTQRNYGLPLAVRDRGDRLRGRPTAPDLDPCEVRSAQDVGTDAHDAHGEQERGAARGCWSGAGVRPRGFAAAPHHAQQLAIASRDFSWQSWREPAAD